MNNFVKWLITILGAVAAILIVFVIASVSIFAAAILFVIIFIISIFSRITGNNLYTTKFMYYKNIFDGYENNKNYSDDNTYDLSKDEYTIDQKDVPEQKNTRKKDAKSKTTNRKKDVTIE